MILEDGAAIRAALATMNPIARESTQLLAHRLIEEPSLVENEYRLGNEWGQACAISLARSGVDLERDSDKVERFIENHGEAVLSIALSIVMFLAREQERQRKWGWVGKAAAVAVGVGLGVFFG